MATSNILAFAASIAVLGSGLVSADLESDRLACINSAGCVNPESIDVLDAATCISGGSAVALGNALACGELALIKGDDPSCLSYRAAEGPLKSGAELQALTEGCTNMPSPECFDTCVVHFNDFQALFYYHCLFQEPLNDTPLPKKRKPEGSNFGCPPWPGGLLDGYQNDPGACPGLAEPIGVAMGCEIGTLGLVPSVAESFPECVLFQEYFSEKYFDENFAADSLGGSGYSGECASGATPECTEACLGAFTSTIDTISYQFPDKCIKSFGCPLVESIEVGDGLSCPGAASSVGAALSCTQLALIYGQDISCVEYRNINGAPDVEEVQAVKDLGCAPMPSLQCAEECAYAFNDAYLYDLYLECLFDSGSFSKTVERKRPEGFDVGCGPYPSLEIGIYGNDEANCAAAAEVVGYELGCEIGKLGYQVDTSIFTNCIDFQTYFFAPYFDAHINIRGECTGGATPECEQICVEAFAAALENQAPTAQPTLAPTTTEAPSTEAPSTTDSPSAAPTPNPTALPTPSPTPLPTAQPTAGAAGLSAAFAASVAAIFVARFLM